MASNDSRASRSRLGRLGRLTGQVGRQFVSGRIRGALSGSERREALHREAFVDSARKVADNLGQLKGVAMKLGQGLALAADSLELPADVREQLARLHDSAEPVPFEQIEGTVVEELEGPLAERFARFDRAPLGTASLAQAHAAALPDGTEVVVKVLHPGVRESVGVDMALAKTFVRNMPGMRGRRAELDAAMELVVERLEEELDYDHEAGNIATFVALYADDPEVTVPRVHPGWSTDRVLTLDRLDGATFEDFEATASAEARSRAGVLLGRTFLEQVFVHRTLHADPHPGNVRFTPDGRLQLLDFGCVQRFDEHFVAHYGRLVLASLDQDREALLQAARDLGIWTGSSAGAAELMWTFCQQVVEPFGRGPLTIGGDDDDIIERGMRTGRGIVLYPELRGPPPLVYLHRSLGGIYTLIRRLQANTDWGLMLRQYCGHAIDVAEGRVPSGPLRLSLG